MARKSLKTSPHSKPQEAASHSWAIQVNNMFLNLCASSKLKADVI
jgi:hypothetical protein